MPALAAQEGRLASKLSTANITGKNIASQVTPSAHLPGSVAKT